MVANELKQAALQIANDIKRTAHSLIPELDKAKVRILEIEAALDSANLCHERCSNFQPEFGGDFQCPSCWVRNNTRSPLVPISSENPREDIFRCRVCDYQIEIPID